MKKNLFNVFLVCVFCVAAIPDMFAQQIKVTGKVTDSTNEGMPGVNVQVKGTATGTITDFDGNYSIDVPDSKSYISVFFYWLCDPASAGRWKKSIECSVER